MTGLNPHKEAQAAIRWLQSYFKSLKAWIRELDGTLSQSAWIPFETNRISTALGNGYQDSTEWVLNWVTRHYYQEGSNRTLFVYVPLATYKASDDTDVFAYFMCCEHTSPAPETGIPIYGKDWLLGGPVIEFLRGKPEETMLSANEDVATRTFRDAKRLQVMKVPMTAFGSEAAMVREVVSTRFAKVLFTEPAAAPGASI